VRRWSYDTDLMSLVGEGTLLLPVTTPVALNSPEKERKETSECGGNSNNNNNNNSLLPLSPCRQHILERGIRSVPLSPLFFSLFVKKGPGGRASFACAGEERGCARILSIIATLEQRKWQ
jgi:hypothetical protein